MPKLSVIVPVYGVENYLKEAVDSLLNQTLQDIEILLIDDGGKDNCPKMVDEFAKLDSRIKPIHKPNGGYGNTCNMGLDMATGEYIAILEPDDFVEPQMYEDLYNIAKNFDSDIVKSPFFHNIQTEFKKHVYEAGWQDFIPEDKSFTLKEYPYFLYYHPSVWSAIYKKEFLDRNNIRFIEAPGAGWTDNPFQVQTMCLAEKINYTSKPYYYWRRINLYECNDLKDFMLPFKRSNEIHQWLEKNNINDERILCNLYRRELSYIKIVLGMKNLDKKLAFKEIKAMLNRMDSEIIKKSNDFKFYEKEFFNYLKQNLSFQYYCQQISRFRHENFSIRLNSREKSVLLFGKMIYHN